MDESAIHFERDPVTLSFHREIDEVGILVGAFDRVFSLPGNPWNLAQCRLDSFLQRAGAPLALPGSSTNGEVAPLTGGGRCKPQWGNFHAVAAQAFLRLGCIRRFKTPHTTTI